MNIQRKELLTELGKTKFKLSNETINVLHGYLNKLMHWNRRMNLIGARTWKEALHTLMIDSFYLADFLDNTKHADNPISYDLGAGAGLPGIMLRAKWHEGNYTMIEAREKRSIFLSTILAEFKLQNTHAYHGRVEEYFAGKEKTANIILSRAFMPYAELINLVQEVLNDDHIIVFLSREQMNDEKVSQIKIDNGRTATLINSMEYKVNNDKRYIWAIKCN